MREPTSLRGEAIEIRRLVKRMARAAEVAPAEVVAVDEDDVGLHGVVWECGGVEVWG